MLCFVHIKGHP